MKKTTLFLTALFAFSANAHNVWLEPDTGNHLGYVMKFGHEETETYPEHKVKEIKLLNQKGQLSDAKYNFEKGEAHFLADNASMVFLKFDNGVWSKLPNGKYVEKTKAQEPTAESTSNPVKLGKAILHWDEQAMKNHNMEYELIPQQKPEVGTPLPILVLHQGKPVEGIKVGIDGDDASFKATNQKGIVEYTPVKGTNKILAKFAEKVVGNPDYSDRKISYMLTFDAK
ncbi:DUF4198 domain-containing protein [Pasteurella bettyae]|uniref:Nickel uptake substrate-specific transmembrane region n=1 Tax=Pasteurella bettyae CCUG 2042 TaxID=1095749 RepID=I3DCD1_9PAST|nr:DUF4198 domain-containing protein [Pasteurella bettyae]EIJ69374.1 nickel uptake substrate-specific transmembrane region [Pasteurella bettyae CCUG 2042]SUB21381.1 Nickel uptake substrate-specific transmembrane region [Pasteurella bettyae]